jgi:succinoglycan biosynthesis transport protein ExoP
MEADRTPSKSRESNEILLQSSSGDWTSHLHLLKRHALISLCAGAVFAGFYIMRALDTEPLYKSVAIVLHDTGPSQGQDLATLGSGRRLGADSFLLRNYLTELRSNSFRQRVVESLSPEEKNGLLPPSENPDREDSPSLHGIIAAANHINLAAGNIFQFEFHHPDPEAAALLANRYCDEFQAFLLERARLGNAAALRFLKSQSEELKLRLERSELEIQHYRQERHLVSLEESQNLIVDRMKDLSKALHHARMEALNGETRVAPVREAIGSADKLERIPAVANETALRVLLQRRDSLLSDRAVLGNRYGPRHPSMIDNQSRLEAVRDEIQMTIEKIAGDLLAEQKTRMDRVARLEEELATAEEEALNLDVVAIEYNVLRRKLETDKRLFTEVHQRLNEALMAGQLSQSDMKIVDRAWAATEPFSPDRNRIYAIGSAIFLLTIGGLPYLIEFFDLRLKTVQEIETRLRLPFLGEIRRFRDQRHAYRLILDGADPSTRESFRQIQSHILLALPELNPGFTFVVTSALPAEGKSFFAANMAASFAQHHYKTLLLDCDYRKPSILRKLDLDKEACPGTDGIRSVTPYLDVMAPAKAIPNATEHIESGAFRDRLKQARRDYAVIIVDTPPAGLFPDAALIGRNGDGFIFIAELGRHRLSHLRGIITRLQGKRNAIVGVVANKSREKSAASVNGYQYGNYTHYRQYQTGT